LYKGQTNRGRCKPSYSSQVDEMKERLGGFILYKGTTQVNGQVLSYNCKTYNVVWDGVLDGKLPRWEKIKCTGDENVIVDVWNY
jgi:hypothetical protein